MPQVEASITINKPISEVFRTAIDLGNSHNWQPDVTDTHMSTERARVGSMVTQIRTTRLFGWKLDLNVDVIDYVPNRMLGYKGVLGRFPISGKIEFESGGGTTTVRENLNIRMGFLYGIFSPMMKGTMTRRTRRALEGLKTHLESKNPGGAVTDFHKNI